MRIESCAACGRGLLSSFWRVADGRPYCHRHNGEATCCCGMPLPAGSGVACSTCRSSAVLTRQDLDAHQVPVLTHLRRVGLVLPVPTRILLARPGQVFPPGVERGIGHVGDTRWSVAGRRIDGPVTIRLAGGLPGHVFRKALTHELGHAATASVRAAQLPLEVTEGFAECVAADFLRSLGDDVQAQAQLETMATRPDPVYGVGYRRMERTVAQQGLVAVAEQLRRGEVPRLSGCTT